MRLALVAIAISFASTLCRAQQTGFAGVQMLTNRETRLQLSSTSRYKIDYSTDLTNWGSWLSAERTAITQTDSGAIYSSNRFYLIREYPTTNAITGDHFATDDGEVIVRPVNHASFVMQWKEIMIYNDPVGANSRYTAFRKADLILVSHTHQDHFSATTLGFVRATNGIIVAPQAVYNQLSATLRAATVVLTNGASTNLLGGIHVEAVPAYNGNHPRGTGNGYVVTIGGQRFYMAGDTGDTPEMRALQDIDVAFLCMNVPFTMTVSAAASAARDFRPRVLYPYHYQNQDDSFANLIELKRLIGTDLGIEVRTRAWY
jgi:L-ascorbate metabolism protein UlaG (beta-lactamase superfamily)